MTGQDILWRPGEEQVDDCNLTRYLRWLESERGLRFDGHDDLWRWSVADLEPFWASLADYFDIRFHAPPERVLANREMPGARWFPGARLNYAEHALARGGSEAALICRNETHRLDAGQHPGGASQRHQRRSLGARHRAHRCQAGAPTLCVR